MRFRRLALTATAVSALALAGSAVGAESVYPTWSATWADPGSPAAAVSGTFTFGILGFPDGTFTITPTSNVSKLQVIPNDATLGDNVAAGTPWAGVFGATAAGNGIYVSPTIEADFGVENTDIEFKFSNAAPPGGWGFTLVDVEEEYVALTMPDADGTKIAGSVPATGVPFNAALNPDSPIWDPAASTVTGNYLDRDTSSYEAAWFRPSVAASSVRASFCYYSDNPATPCLQGASSEGASHSMRAFIAALADKVTGTAKRSDTGAAMAGVTVTLKNSGGTAIGTATTDASGAYSFPRVYAIAGYSASAAAPSGLEATSSASVSLDLSKGPGAADFTFAAVTAPAITTRRAVVVGASRLIAWNRITSGGIIRVTGRIGGLVACTGSSKAAAAGLVPTVCPLNARARAIVAPRRSTRVRVTSVLTAADGKKATDVATAVVRRRVLPVTG